MCKFSFLVPSVQYTSARPWQPWQAVPAWPGTSRPAGSSVCRAANPRAVGDGGARRWCRCQPSGASAPKARGQTLESASRCERHCSEFPDSPSWWRSTSRGKPWPAPARLTAPTRSSFFLLSGAKAPVRAQPAPPHRLHPLRLKNGWHFFTAGWAAAAAARPREGFAGPRAPLDPPLQRGAAGQERRTRPPEWGTKS